MHFLLRTFLSFSFLWFMLQKNPYHSISIIAFPGYFARWLFNKLVSPSITISRLNFSWNNRNSNPCASIRTWEALCESEKHVHYNRQLPTCSFYYKFHIRSSDSSITFLTVSSSAPPTVHASETGSFLATLNDSQQLNSCQLQAEKAPTICFVRGKTSVASLAFVISILELISSSTPFLFTGIESRSIRSSR